MCFFVHVRLESHQIRQPQFSIMALLVQFVCFIICILRFANGNDEMTEQHSLDWRLWKWEWTMTHPSVLLGNWYIPPPLSLVPGHKWYGLGRGRARSFPSCQSVRSHSNRPDNAHKKARLWSLCTHRHLDQHMKDQNIVYTVYPLDQYVHLLMPR